MKLLSTFCALFVSMSTLLASGPDSLEIPEFAKADFPPASAGNIMMDNTSVHVPSQDKTYYEVLVWDTKSGKSKLYYYSYSDKLFKAYEDNVQLPSSPLE